MREFGCWVRRFLGIVVGCLWLNFKLEKIKICFENIELYFVNLFRAWLTNLTRTIKNILSTLHKVLVLVVLMIGKPFAILLKHIERINGESLNSFIF